MSKSGFTLLEILIGLGLLSILSSIAVVQYQGYILDVEKRELYNSSVRFASRVNACITSVGQWADGTPFNTAKKPCKALTKEDLKKKLDYTCPPDAECVAFEHSSNSTTTPQAEGRYYCLSIKKKVSDKYLQVIAQVRWDMQNDYTILCSDKSANNTDYAPLTDATCAKDANLKSYAGFMRDKKNAQGDPIPDPDNPGTNKKELILCQWK